MWMKVPRIVKIVLALVVVGIAYHFLVSGSPNAISGKSVEFRVVHVERADGNVIIQIRNTGKDVIEVGDIAVATEGPCEALKFPSVGPGEEHTLVFRCPAGDVVRVSGGGVEVKKRLR